MLNTKYEGINSGHFGVPPSSHMFDFDTRGAVACI